MLFKSIFIYGWLFSLHFEVNIIFSTLCLYGNPSEKKGNTVHNDLWIISWHFEGIDLNSSWIWLSYLFLLWVHLLYHLLSIFLLFCYYFQHCHLYLTKTRFNICLLNVIVLIFRYINWSIIWHSSCKFM